MNVHNDIKNALFLTTGFILTLIVVFTIFLGCNGVATPVQEAIKMIGDYFGGIASLVAAYIASIIFNGWKVQQEFNNRLKLLQDSILACDDLCSGLRLIAHPLAKIKAHAKFLDNAETKEEQLISHEDLDKLCYEFNDLKISQYSNFRKLIVLISRCNKYFKDEEFKRISTLINSEANKYSKLPIPDSTNLTKLYADSNKLLAFITTFTKEIEDKVIVELDKKSSPFYSNK